MKKFTFLTAAAAMLVVGSSAALAQGHGGAARNGGWQRGGSAHGAWQGSGNRGSWRGGGNWYGGAWRGGHYPRAGFRHGGPAIWGVWPYPFYYPYPAYAAPPYPIYADPGPTVYVERYPPPYVEPPRVAAAPEPAPAPPPERLERYTLSAQELFDFDRSVLRLPQPKLDEIARVLSRNPQINDVTITGYTDRIGTDSYNLKLSQRRADAVKAYLVGQGVAATRLTATGKGKANPVVQCAEANRAALIKCLEPNRRVEVEEITVERRVR